MKRPRKILIFGNIGSGKTSLARSLSEAIGIPCGSIDACRISYSDGSPSGEASAWSHFLEKVESSESLILECVGGGPFFELLKMALDKSGAELTVLFVHTPAEECLKRVKIRGFHAPYPHFSQSIDEVIHSLSLSLRDGLSRLPNVVNILDGEKSVEDLVEEASALIGKKTHPASDSESASKGSSPLSWKHSKVSACGTHHVNEGKALYGRKFDHVLPFHTPGLAPVDDYSGAYHIYPDGSSAYSVRFKRTVGFYQGFAAVEDRDGKWFHILPDGEALYTHLYAWSGIIKTAMLRSVIWTGSIFTSIGMENGFTGSVGPTPAIIERVQR